MRYARILRKALAASALSLIALSIFGGFAYAEAQVACVNGKAADGSGKYCSLTTLPGAFEPTKAVDPIKVITNIYGVSIGLAAVLAVGMIIWAGIEYATTEAITGKSAAKEKWTGALWGLLLLLASYLILRTINSDLVNINLDLGAPKAGELAGSNVLGKAYESALNNAQKVSLSSTTGDPKVAAIAASQAQIDKKIVEAIQNGDTAAAQKIAQDTIQSQQNVASQITDPLAAKEAQVLVKFNVAKTNVTLGTTAIISGLESGKYPVASDSGPRLFQETRGDFLSTMSRDYAELRNTDSAAAEIYRQYALAQLKVMDDKWLENLKKCPRGYTVENGCNN
ncbi:MAG: hypothetical protein HZA81_04290 [Candidatus Taylorbacteria bacterium]|nr:hypothetical protein [Candidatus Taylorbacteria bacterium]